MPEGVGPELGALHSGPLGEPGHVLAELFGLEGAAIVGHEDVALRGHGPSLPQDVSPQGMLRLPAERHIPLACLPVHVKKHRLPVDVLEFKVGGLTDADARVEQGKHQGDVALLVLARPGDIEDGVDVSNGERGGPLIAGPLEPRQHIERVLVQELAPEAPVGEHAEGPTVVVDRRPREVPVCVEVAGDEAGRELLQLLDPGVPDEVVQTLRYRPCVRSEVAMAFSSMYSSTASANLMEAPSRSQVLGFDYPNWSVPYADYSAHHPNEESRQ